MVVKPWKSTWKSTWWLMETHTALHAVHVGVPGRVSGVDAASCKSVGSPVDPGIFSQIVI